MTNLINKGDFQQLTYQLQEFNNSVKNLIGNRVNITADLLGFFLDEYNGLIECEITDVNAYQGDIKVSFKSPLDEQLSTGYVSIKDLADMKIDADV